jgi:hypothetical protein
MLAPARPVQLQPETLERRDTPATLYALVGNNALARFNSSILDSTVPIQGLIGSGEQVVGIDVRPRTGQLYALAVRMNTARLLVINPHTGATTQVGSEFSLPLGGSAGFYGFDFNPTTDCIRVVSRDGLNLRLHPDTGGIARGPAGGWEVSR